MSSSQVEMCDCGEPECTFTKKEAEKYGEMMSEYRRLAFSNPKSLSDGDSFLLDVYKQSGQPPWMENREWKELCIKNPDFAKRDRRTIEDQMVDKISELLESQNK
jgi:hypothetical protein